MSGPGPGSRETPASETAGKWRDQVSRALGTGLPPVTWRDYQDIVSHARHEYLAKVQAARVRREQISGPVFEEFAATERAAWLDYHQAGRAAWLAYQDSQRTLDAASFPMPADVHPYPVERYGGAMEARMPRHTEEALRAWAAVEAAHGLNCPECGIPWRQPSPGCPRAVNDLHPLSPQFTPAPETES